MGTNLIIVADPSPRMVNPFLIISPIGMILVGLVALFYWRCKTEVPWRYFGFGALIWAIAIGIKLAMDLTITTPFYLFLSSYGALVALAGLSLYVGLRTGLLESGLSYLAVAKTGFRTMKGEQALAFGIGFGAIEAIVLGGQTLLNLAALIIYPQLIALLPPAQQAALDLPTIVVFAAILERAFVLLIHVFTSVLVVYSVMAKMIRYLVYSILFKTLVDGMLPGLTSVFDASIVSGIYAIEVPIAALGVIAFFGTRWILQKFESPGPLSLTFGAAV
jgi:uncharacterized membrane protein YhfC